MSAPCSHQRVRSSLREALRRERARLRTAPTEEQRSLIRQLEALQQQAQAVHCTCVQVDLT